MIREKNPAHGGYNHHATVAEWRSIKAKMTSITYVHEVIEDNVRGPEKDADGFPRECSLWLDEHDSEEVMELADNCS